MAELRTLRLDDWTGGLNLRSDAFNLKDNESPDLLNVEIDPRGGFYTRLGTQRYNTQQLYGNVGIAAQTTTRLLSWTFGTTRQLLVMSYNDTLSAQRWHAFNGTSTTPISQLGTAGKSVGSSADPNATASLWTVWDAATPVVYMHDRTRWNGSTATSLTASATGAWQESLTSPTGTHMPNCWHVATHVDRLWCAWTTEDGTTRRNRVRFSHPGFPESWRSADYIDVVRGDGGITALVPFRDALYVFKRSSIHAIYGYDTDTFQLALIADNIGADSDVNVCTMDGLMYISNRSGVYVHDGSTFTVISDPIKTVIEGLTTPMSISAARRKVYCGVNTGAYSYVFDPLLEAWTRHSYNAGSSCGLFGDVVDHQVDSSNSYLLGCMSADRSGYIHRFDIPSRYTDQSGNFTAYAWTQWLDAGQVSNKKMWRRPDFVIQQETADTAFTVDVYRDWEEATIRKTFTVTTLADPGAAGSELKRGNNLGLARAVALKITGPQNKRWGVESISFKFQPRRIR